MQIRPCTDQDLQAVVELFTASVHELAGDEYDAKQLEAWAPSPPDLNAWRARLNSRTSLLAEIDGKPAGFVAFEMDGHIDLLYTSPAHARKGVATTLLHLAAAELSAAGVTRLFTEASAVARPFFERNGFQVVREERVQLRGVTFRRFLMRR